MRSVVHAGAALLDATLFIASAANRVGARSGHPRRTQVSPAPTSAAASSTTRAIARPRFFAPWNSFSVPLEKNPSVAMTRMLVLDDTDAAEIAAKDWGSVNNRDLSSRQSANKIQPRP